MNQYPKKLTRGVIAQVVRSVFLCRLPLLTPLIIWAYAYFFKADFYGKSLGDFDALLDFFTRTRDLRLKQRKLSLDVGVVSPVESTITFWEKLSHNAAMPIKGAGFTVSQLLGFDAPHFQTGIVFYLSPGNYHRVHAPDNLMVEGYFTLPGKLASVAPKYLKSSPLLLAENLRKVILARNEENMRIAIVLVGAKNVGNIICPRLETFNGEAVAYQKGEELGYFTLGSTVVMLLESELLRAYGIGDKIDVLDPLITED